MENESKDYWAAAHTSSSAAEENTDARPSTPAANCRLDGWRPAKPAAEVRARVPNVGAETGGN
jgi:hypothetical protein